MQRISLFLLSSFTLFFLFLVLTLSAIAGIDWKAFDVGNFQSAIFNTGIVGFPQDVTRNPSGWWPAGTNDSYIFSGDLWLGAKKGGKIGVSISDARSSEIWPADDVPEVISKKPGVTTKNTPTSQSIYYKSTDTNPAVNKNPLGLQIEINGFQWSYAPLYDFFILEHKIKNIGKETLQDLFIAFRYDLDVSTGETGTASYSADDFTALDETPDAQNPNTHPNRRLSYIFSNASAKGYVGLRVLDAYMGKDAKTKDKKIFFNAHKRITIATDPSTDEEMYSLISVPGVDPLPANFDDQRFIQSWGPVKTFAPGEEVNVIIVVGIGEGLNGLRTSVDWAQKIYDDNYIAPGPPPSPKLTAYPGDRKVTLVWDGKETEKYTDPTDKEKVFEGYRVYRRGISYEKVSGKPSVEWKLLAEFDKKSATGSFFTVIHVGRKSEATITNEGLEDQQSKFFTNAEYLLKFTSNTTFEVVNTSTWETLEYNPKFPDDGAGYAVIDDPAIGKPFPDGTYRPGKLIYFGGLYVKIDGKPLSGDIFKIVSTKSRQIGEDKGTKNFYIDENLTNGIRYIYAVTSFDTGNPKTGLPAMESSKIDTTTHVFPRSYPAGYQAMSLESKAKGTVKIEPMVVDPSIVTGHRYKIIWKGAKAEENATESTAIIGGFQYHPPAYEIIDLDAGNKKVVEEKEFEWFNPKDNKAVEALSPAFDGIVLKLTGVDVAYDSPTANKIRKVDLVKGSVDGWSVDLKASGTGDGKTTGPNIFWATYFRPHTYRIKFLTNTTIEVFDAADKQPVKFNTGLADGYAINNEGWTDVYSPAATRDKTENVDLFRLYLRGAYIVIKDPKSQLGAGDEFQVEMAGVQAPQDGDEIVLITTPTINLTKANVDEQLKKVRVVPNPYILTNRAVTSQGTDKCFFTHLPAKCRIRIYTLAGEFVKELMHDSGKPFDPEDRFAQGESGGTEPFDLLSYNDQALASGIYVYCAEALDANGTTIGKKIGRFAIIR